MLVCYYKFQMSQDQNYIATPSPGEFCSLIFSLYNKKITEILSNLAVCFIVSLYSIFIIQKQRKRSMIVKAEYIDTLSSNRWSSTEQIVTSIKKEKKIKKSNHSSEDQFEPEYHTLKKMRIPMNRSRLSKGNWSLSQNQVYLNFLKNNKLHFISEVIRRQERIFCKLSQALNKKRTPDQCRSHHQKLLTKHKDSLDGIIMELQKKIQLNGAKEQPYMKIRVIGKYHYNKFLRQKEEGKPTDYLSPSQLQDLRMERIIPAGVIKEEKTYSFYKTTIFENSAKIIIQIDSAAIQSY